MMHVQIIQNGVDTLLLRRDLIVHKTEKVDEVGFHPAWITLGPACSCALPESSVDIAFGAPSIIDFLFGSLRRTNIHVNGLLPWIALGCYRSHLINVEDHSFCRSLLPQGFDAPLF